MAIKIQRLPEVLSLRGVSRSKHYLDINEGLFTSPVRLGPKCVGWPESETEAINLAVVAGKSKHEIRELVLTLEEERYQYGDRL